MRRLGFFGLRQAPVGLALLLALAGCQRPPASPASAESGHASAQAGGAASAPLALQLAALDVARATHVIEKPTAPFTGTLQSLTSTSVQAQGSGQIRDITVRVGDAVRRGQVLARVNDQDNQARLLQAQANVAGVQAQLALAQNNLRRYQTLFAQGFAARVEVERAQVEVTTQQENLRAQQAQVSIARKGVQDTVITAPISGRVVQRQVGNGQSVQPGQTLFELMDPQDLEVSGTLAGDGQLTPQLGQLLRFVVQGQNGQTHSARLTRLSPQADPLSRSQTFFARVEPPVGTLQPGQFVRGTLQGSQPIDGVGIPAAALKNPDQPWVWVVRNQKLVRQPVEVIDHDRLNDRVLVRGVADGELVVVIELSPEAAGRPVQLATAPAVTPTAGG